MMVAITPFVRPWNAVVWIMNNSLLHPQAHKCCVSLRRWRALRFVKGLFTSPCTVLGLMPHKSHSPLCIQSPHPLPQPLSFHAVVPTVFFLARLLRPATKAGSDPLPSRFNAADPPVWRLTTAILHNSVGGGSGRRNEHVIDAFRAN